MRAIRTVLFGRSSRLFHDVWPDGVHTSTLVGQSRVLPPAKAVPANTISVGYNWADSGRTRTITSGAAFSILKNGSQ